MAVQQAPIWPGREELVGPAPALLKHCPSQGAAMEGTAQSRPRSAPQPVRGPRAQGHSRAPTQAFWGLRFCWKGTGPVPFLITGEWYSAKKGWSSGIPCTWVNLENRPGKESWTQKALSSRIPVRASVLKRQSPRDRRQIRARQGVRSDC